MNIGEAIQKIRKQRKVKQFTLAEECGITQTYLSLIESNQKEPNLSVLKKIANALEIPLPVLLFLSIDKDDVSTDKQEAFNLLFPSIKSLLNEFFSRDNTTDQNT